MIPAGGSRLPASHETVDARQHFMVMNGHEVYKFATRIVAQSAGNVLRQCAAARSTRSTYSCLIRPICVSSRARSKKLGIPEDRIYTNLQKYGNTSCASIPLCLSKPAPRDG